MNIEVYYCRAEEISENIGISVDYINELTTSGMIPFLTEVNDVHTKLYNIEDVIEVLYAIAEKNRMKNVPVSAEERRDLENTRKLLDEINKEKDSKTNNRE